MKDFPSCFGESGVQVADASSSSSSSSSSATNPKHAQNLVTCIYKCRLLQCRSCFITVTWAKNLMGSTLGISIDDLCKVDIKPWLFAKRKGSRTVNLDNSADRVSVHWDLTNAKFGSRPEPIEGFFVAVVFNEEILLLIGDLKKEAYRKIDTDSIILTSNSVFISKRENLFGKRFYGAKAQFCDKGKIHDIGIECDYSDGGISEPSLVIRIDNKMVMQVRRLRWKFRGNYTIQVDGIPVEIFWDVHNWLFGGNAAGNAVFMFQSYNSVSPEKLWPGNAKVVDSTAWLDSGFSMIFYAWKSE